MVIAEGGNGNRKEAWGWFMEFCLCPWLVHGYTSVCFEKILQDVDLG